MTGEVKKLNKKAWYLIYTKPRQEKTALENLQRQQFDCFLPMATVRKRQRMQWVHNMEPMFPRYLFIHLNTQSDNWSPIRSTLGVAHLVRFGGAPAQIPDALIEVLHEKEKQLSSTDLRPTFSCGDSVKVLDGVMAGYQGIFEAKNGGDRVNILLEMAGRYTCLQLPSSSIDHA